MIIIIIIINNNDNNNNNNNNNNNDNNNRFEPIFVAVYNVMSAQGNFKCKMISKSVNWQQL